eukprot:3012573-Amphidinium_carterae.1
MTLCMGVNVGGGTVAGDPVHLPLLQVVLPASVLGMQGSQSRTTTIMTTITPTTSATATRTISTLRKDGYDNHMTTTATTDQGHRPSEEELKDLTNQLDAHKRGVVTRAMYARLQRIIIIAQPLKGKNTPNYEGRDSAGLKALQIFNNCLAPISKLQLHPVATLQDTVACSLLDACLVVGRFLVPKNLKSGK